MANRLLPACYLMISAALVSAISSKFTVASQSVEVLPGDDRCISNCSHMSAKGNTHLACSVEECKVLEESKNNAQKSEVDKDMVYFEIYFDEVEKKYKLALNFKWSPVDNVSMERTKGYLINVSDGVSSYSTCYVITTPMGFHKNAHDVFYNDCFGKVSGTTIKPESVITVNITTLPFWIANHDDGKVTFTVEVPSCKREELYDLPDCIKPGGRATRDPCVTDCHTFSKVEDVAHPVNCTLSRYSLNSVGGKEKCEKVNKLKTGTPSQPKHLKKEQEWYKFIDNDGDVKIALNFSWTPRRDSSMENLHGYYLEITPKSVSDLTYFNKCFSVHTNLTQIKHSQTEFFYDCYGRGLESIKPGEEFHIHLNSLPEGEGREVFSVTVPGCEDDRVEDVTFCIKERQKQLKGTVEEIFCHNRSVKYRYHMSPDFGDFATILFCEYANQATRPCDNNLEKLRGLAPNGTLYNISLPSYADLTLNYSIILHGSHHSFERSHVLFDFSKCIKSAGTSGQTTIMIVLILVFGILCLVGLMFLICFMCNKECWRKFFVKYIAKGQNVNVPAEHVEMANDPDHPPNNREPITQVQPSIIPTRVRVYVVFMPDHEYHEKVVHWFCSYLKEDLGLDVRVNLWEEGEVAVNSVLYMETNLKNADKVIVICSEGTRNCFSKEEYSGDMFTPVVRNICQQAFVGNNPGKFLVGFFDYSDQSHVPELLNEQCMMYFSSFKLMKQFEQFYFRLVGVEQYQDGGIQRIEKIAFDRYYDPALTRHGKSLKEAIDRMQYFIEDNPTWYNDLHGLDQPQSTLHASQVPRPINASLVQKESILDPTPPNASIAYIDAAPPPDLHNRSTTIPKVSGVPQQTQQIQNQRPQYNPQPIQKGGRYQPLISMTSTSTESSFIVPETETEDLSTSPSGVDSPTQDGDEERYHFPMRQLTASDLFQSFHPESFQDKDYATLDDDSRLLSAETEITRIGLTPSMERMREGNGIMYPFLSVEEEEDGSGDQPPPDSGVITLATIDDDEDIEEHIKSINQSQFL